MEIRRHGRLREPQTRGRPPQRFVYGFGRIGDKRREARQTRNLRRHVMRRDRLPRGIGTAPFWCRPQRLTFVEIGGGPRAETLGNDAGPIDPRNLCRQIGNRGHRHDMRRWSIRRCLQCGKRPRPQRHGHAVERPRQIVIGNGAVGDAIPIPVARHGDGSTRHPAQQCGGLRKRLVGLTEIGIDRDAGG